MYRVERSAGREVAYAAYRARQGRSLEDFAIWCALAERYGADWHGWPHALQHPANPEVAAFAGGQSAGGRLPSMGAVAARRAAHRRPGHRGPGGHGAGRHERLGRRRRSRWRRRLGSAGCAGAGVTAGAPPDEFNQLGQDWSQPPWRPDRLAEQAYEPFRAVVNMALRHSGGVRIDHIIGMFRLWWIPKGAAPTEGTYVRYDHDAMIGIIALEAHRAGALVVGEDLGTVEPWVRDYLRERGLFGTSILWFESGRLRRTLARRALARVLPVVGDHARSAADARIPGRRARAVTRNDWGC